MSKRLKEALKPILIQDEGVKHEIYLDHLGNPTFGIGHLVTKDDPEYGKPVGTPVSKERVAEVFDRDMDNTLKDARRLTDLDRHPLDAQLVVASMVFQMGASRTSKFKRFLSNLDNSNYEEAAEEMLDSRWAQQTPSRVERLAQRMRSVDPSDTMIASGEDEKKNLELAASAQPEQSFGSGLLSSIIPSAHASEILPKTAVTPTQEAFTERGLGGGLLSSITPNLSKNPVMAGQQSSQLRLDSVGEAAPYTKQLAIERPEEMKDSLEPLGLGEYLLRGAGAIAGGAVTSVGQVPSGAARLFSVAHDETLNMFLAPFEALNEDLAKEVKEFVTEPITYAPWWTNPELALESVGEAIKDTGEELSPEEPNFVEKVLGGVGQLGAQIATLLVAGPAAASGALTAQGADIIGEKLDSTRTTEEPERWEGLATVLGAGVTAVTEKYGIDNLLRRIPASTRNRLVRVLSSAGSEAAQEVLEEVGQNLVIMGFDPNRVPETTLGDLGEQAAVGGSVGAIAGLLIPGRKRAAQTKVLMDKANESIVEAAPTLPKETVVDQKLQAVEGSGITGVKIKKREFVTYVQKHPEIASKMKSSVVKSFNNNDNPYVDISAQEFATHIFGTEHFNGLIDDMQFSTAGTNRTGITSREAVDQIKENREALVAKAEKEQKETIRQRTIRVLDDFAEGKEVDLNEVLAKAPNSVVTRLDQYLKEIQTETLTTEQELREGRIQAVQTRREQLEQQIFDTQNDIDARKEEKKPTKRLEKKLAKLENEDKTLAQEEYLFNPKRLPPGPIPERYRPKVAETAKVEDKAGRLRRLNVKSSQETEREARKAFRAAKKGAREDISSAQTVLSTLVDKMGIDSDRKAKYVKTIKTIQSLEDLKERLPRLQERILEDIDRQRKAQVKGAITKVVKKGVKAKTTPAVNSLLKEAQKILKMRKKDAQALLDQEGSERDPMLNTLLGLKAGTTGISAHQVEKILLDLDQVVEGGRAIGVANVLYQTSQREKIRDRVLQAIGDKPPTDIPKREERIQGTLVYTFLGWSGSWRNKLQHVFTSKDRKEVDALLKDLSLFNESRQYDVGIRTSSERLQKLVKDRVKMTDRAVRKQWSKDNTEQITLGQFTMANGEQHTLKMTKAELRMAWMQSQQPDIKESFKDPANNGGFTDAVFESIQAQFTDFDRAMIAAQQEFYSEYYDRINLAYRLNYGLNLPKVENYVPVRRDFGDGQPGEEFLRSILYRGGPKPASLQARKPGAKQRVKRASDITTLQSHMAEMEYFIAYGNKVNTLNSVFTGSNNKVINLIADKYGRKVADVIQEDLRWFANKGAMQGTAVDTILLQLMRNFGFAQLGAKPQIGLKQLASFAAFAQDVSVTDFTTALIKIGTPTGYREARTLMNKSVFFRERGMNLDNDFRDLAKDTHDNKLLNFMGQNPGFTKIMMLPIRYGDKGAIFLGGYAHAKAMMAKGATEAEALDSFARLANATQQSSDPDQLSSIQRTSAFGRVFAQFLSSANAIARAEYEAISEFSKGRLSSGELAKRIGIYHFLIPNLIMFIGNGFEWESEDQLKASILGSFVGALIIGDVLEFATNVVLGNSRPFDIDGPHPFKFMQALIEAFQGDWDIGWDEFVEGSKTIEKAAEFGGTLTGIPLEALYNMLRGTAIVTEGALEGKGRALEEGGKLMLGYSPYVIEKTK